MTNSSLVIFLRWFFVKAPFEILHIGRNFLAWTWHFFSIGYFVPRLFSPWHRDITGYGRGFDLKRFLHVWGWNLISRVIGAVMRLITMIVGVLTVAFVILATFFAFLIWYFLPVLIPILFIIGIITLS